MSFFAHMLFIVPIPMSIISFCTAASMHIRVTPFACGAPSRATDDSHSPAFIVGNSIASALAAPSDSARAMEAGRKNLMDVSAAGKNEVRNGKEWGGIEDGIVGRCRSCVNEILQTIGQIAYRSTYSWTGMASRVF